MRVSKACWMSFLDWLEAGGRPTSPTALRWTLGPVWLLVPRARRAADVFGPWLVSLLEARQRAGLPLPDDAAVIERDLAARPLTRAEAQDEAEREASEWIAWRLEAELARLLRLVEAPMPLFYRAEWLAWEARYWALVITLARIGQRCALLARQPGAEPAEQQRAAAEAVWQRALHPDPVVA